MTKYNWPTVWRTGLWDDLPPASEGWGKVIVSGCLSTPGGWGLPHLHPIIPGHVRLGGTLARSGWGIPGYPPCPGMGYPPPGQDRGYPRVLPILGWDSPSARSGRGWGVPWSTLPDRTTEGVLATRWVVCLLCSCRRTFLFIIFFRFWDQVQFQGQQ